MKCSADAMHAYFTRPRFYTRHFPLTEVRGKMVCASTPRYCCSMMREDKSAVQHSCSYDQAAASVSASQQVTPAGMQEMTQHVRAV